jgi:hypothetical protein
MTTRILPKGVYGHFNMIRPLAKPTVDTISKRRDNGWPLHVLHYNAVSRNLH